MKKSLFVFPIILLILTGALFAQQMDLDDVISDGAWIVEEAVPAGTVVAILNFDSSSEAFSEHVLTELASKLFLGQRVSVIDRQTLLPVAREMNLNLSGDVSDQAAQPLGIRLDAQSIVSGSFTDMGGFHRFRIRVIHTANMGIQAQIFLDLNNAQAAAMMAGFN